MPDLIITPNRSSITGVPQIDFIGASGSGISLQVLQNGTVAFIGSAGGLFSISDSLTGTLMSVTDIAGLPIFEVYDSDKVIAGAYNTNALVVSGSGVSFGTDYVPPNRSIYVSGDIEYLGSLYSGGTNIGDLFYPIGNPSGYITGLAGTGNFATLAQLTSASGVLQTQITTNASSISTLTTNLTSTGANLLARINSVGSTISGNLTATGANLFGRINSVGSTISGNLTTTGTTLNTKINTLSGYLPFIREPVTNVTTNYTVLGSNGRIYCNNTNSMTLTFPSAVTNSGQIVQVKLINTGLVRFTGTAGQYFDGLPSYEISGRYMGLQVHSNGADWYLW